MSDRALRWVLQIAGVTVVIAALVPVVTAVVGLTVASGAPLVGFGRALVGSLAVCGLAMAVAAPLGIATGVHLAEYGTGSMIDVVRGLLRVSAQIPSVVIGVFGAVVFAGTLEVEQPVVVAGLTLGLLVLPLVTGRTELSLQRVPPEMREAAQALGATHWQVVRGVALPAARDGIVSGLLAALARVLGATAPLIVLGATGLTTLPQQLYAGGGGRDAWFVALVLMLATGGLAWAGENLRRRALP